MARPAKLYMQKVFKKKILNSDLQYSSVLDLACGYGDYFVYFKGKDYIGIDSDLERIKQAQTRYPEAKFFCSTIEELPENISADLVICIQTIGFNNYFKVKNTLKVVKNIVSVTNKNGHCFFLEIIVRIIFLLLAPLWLIILSKWKFLIMAPLIRRFLLY